MSGIAVRPQVRSSISSCTAVAWRPRANVLNDKMPANVKPNLRGVHSNSGGNIHIRPEVAKQLPTGGSLKGIGHHETQALRTLVHENVHSHSPMTAKAYSNAGAFVEEATTETAARMVTAHLTGRLAPLAAGAYQPEIDKLASLVHSSGAASSLEDAHARIQRASITMRQTREIIDSPKSYVEHFAKHAAHESAEKAAALAKEIHVHVKHYR